jgi:thiamine transporter
LTGFLLGLLQLILGFSTVVHPVQGFLDYILAFATVGLAGIVAAGLKQSLAQNRKGQWMTLAVVGAFIGSLLRFICHFISGIVFFGSYAPKGQPVALYSLIYNGTYMLASFVISAILVILVINAAPRTMLNSTAKKES